MLYPLLILFSLLWYGCGVFGLYKDWTTTFPKDPKVEWTTWGVISICAMMGPMALILWCFTVKDQRNQRW